MPANLTPVYFKAEERYKSAATTEEKILALEEMLAVMPKHKGTDGLKADLRRKLSALKEQQLTAKKSSGKHTDIFHVVRGGAGQIALIGLPNTGKSSIVAALTNAKVNVADFPFATAAPVPGMAKFEDVQIQIIDMPPITADYSAPGQVGTYRNCDLIGIVIDLSADAEEQMLILLDYLESKSLLINEKTQTAEAAGNQKDKKAFYICTKSDIEVEGAFEKVQNNAEGRFDCIKFSTQQPQLIASLPKIFFEQLGIIRIYAKPPGKKPDMNDPFTLPIGSNVHDLATVIHRELADKLKTAKVWGTGVYDGQNVQKTHVLHDKDVVELHFA
ncbi:MAG: GTPase [Phycisphaerae bacterium]